MKLGWIKGIYWKYSKFSNKSRPRTMEGKDKKADTYGSAYALYESRKLIFNAFKSGIFPTKETQGKGLKLLTPI